MASVKDGENVSLESGRRTRSGRTITSEASVLVPTSKKRTTKKQSGEKGAIVSETLEEDEPNLQPTEQNNIPEMLADSARGAVDGESSGSHTVAMREDGQSETRNESPRKDVSVVSEASGKAISEKVRLVTQGALDHDHLIMTNEGVTVHHFDENDSSYLFKKKVFDDADSGQIKISDSVIDSTTRDDTEIPIRDKANHLSPMGADEEDTKDFDYCVVGQSPDDDTDSDLAIAEDFPTNSSEATLANVDTISEDELPLPSKSRLDEADDISSAEDSISKSTELAVGTCIENELPSSNTNSMKLLEATHLKRKMEGSSEKYNQTNSNTVKTGDEPTQKKIKVEGDGDEEQQDKELKKERKKLPDLDKYWKAVKDDSTDFTGWTYLLQYVDQETDIEAAREAYDAFLSHYPYCYGYWRKYADYEKRKGLKSKCNEVFERGLKAIPLSVDLWIHYLNHAKTNYGDNEDYIRTQFERAINACGLEFRSDKLWDAYIKWETEGKRYQRVVKIYDRLLSIPTQGYNGHFGNFQDLINNHSVTETISAEELMKHRSEIRGLSKTSKEQAEDEVVSSDKIEGNDVGNDSDNIRENEEIAILKEKIISARRKIHKSTVAAVTARWTFEESIKRPYFHVKPLERCQLKNWNDYLDFEIEKGDRTRILILFERCLIACALYDEFWLKLIRYLETQNDPELKSLTSDAYSRACTIHHPHKPSLHLMWSAFEECHSDFDKAAKILVDLEKTCPNLLQVAYRRINLERRRGDYDKCKELYEHYINNAKNKNISGSLAIKYARFCNKIMSDLDGGMKVLHQALEKDPANTRVALQMVDMALQRPIVDENEVVNIIDKFMSRENVELEQRALFAQRKVEFLEDFGSTANRLLEAQRALQTALNSVNEAKKKGESSPNKKTTSPRNGKDTAAAINSIPPSTTYNNTNNTSTTYSYGSGTNSNYFAQTGDTSYQQQQYDGYYNHWQYGSGYSGYGQWSGYGNYY